MGIDVTDEQRPFECFGASETLMYSAHPEVLFHGPRGTSKTFTYLNKIVALATVWPGARFLILRKTMKSLRETALRTLEDKVLPRGHPALHSHNRKSADPQYPIGESLILTGGMDDPEKHRSLEANVVVFEEATEFTPDEVDVMRGCLRGGGGSYYQMIFATNPGPPNHWLIKRALDSSTPMLNLPSRHEDNPTLYDHVRGVWLPEGQRYLRDLDEMTGHRLLRLRHGKWAAAEGIAFPEYDDTIHVIPRFEIPSDWPRYMSIDFGYTNPFVCQWWAVDEDGRAFMYREIYYSGRLVEEHAKHALALTGGEDIEAIIADHDAEGRATWAKHFGQGTIAAKKDRELGIEIVKARLRKAGDNRPRVFYLRDSLVERDQSLSDKGAPMCTPEEYGGLIWHKGTGKVSEKEDIVKKDDHGYDATRYILTHLEDSGGVGVFFV